MNILLIFCRFIDALNDRLGAIAKWAIFIACVVSAANALVRYTLDYSSNAWLEIQWYLFAAGVMLGAAKVLRVNEHVRVDVFYGRMSGKNKVRIDLFGIVFFLLPVMSLFAYLSFPLFIDMLRTNESSSNAGGLIRWPAMMMLPLGFSTLVLQGLAEAIKRIAWLAGKHELPMQYERPLQ